MSKLLVGAMWALWWAAAVAGAARPGGGFSRASGLARRPRPCAHAGDEVNAVAARAALAAHVFVGKARSRSLPREPGGRYAVTFVVVRSLRAQGTSLSEGAQVRLPFRDKPPGRHPHPLCRQSYDFSQKDLVRTDIKRGGKYLVFLTGHGPLNFSVLGEPVISKRKNVRAVKEVLCKNCRSDIGVTGLRDLQIKSGERLRLVCKSKGNPLPALAWYKDGAPIIVSNRIRILFKKKRSALEVLKTRLEDSGRYECRATSATGTVLSSWSSVTIHPPSSSSPPDNTTTLWPLNGTACPIDSYCLNGGTCTYYQTVGELVCQCAEGFKGQRCESKDVSNRSSMYRPMSYFCKLGISSSYYC